jgi:hypothetical protein
MSVAFFSLLFFYALFAGCIKKEKPITTAVGEPTGPPVSTVIGPAGGELASADGRLSMSVPPGTVAADTTFSIQPITSLAPTSIGAGYRLEPGGTTFTQPVSLIFSIPEAGVERTSLGGIGIAFHEDNGNWRWLSVVSRDETNNTLTVQATHFSDHAAIEGLRISPGKADVDEGKTVQLQVQLCSSGPDDGPLAGLVCECTPLNGFDTNLSNWAVNSIPGGNSTYGTIAESVSGATFTAPSKAPEPNTVRVSVNAQATLLPGEGNTSTEKTVLFSYITIGSKGKYKGTFTVSSEMGSIPWTGRGEATWTPLDPEKDTGEYTVSGMITPDKTEYSFGDAICILNESKQKFEGIGEIRKDPLGQYWTIETTQFSATCTDRNGNVIQYPAFLNILWASSCISQGQWAPVDDINHLTGSFKWNGCVTVPGPIPSATVTWDFKKE